MDTILNLISVAGIWSSTALLAWGAALALEQILCAAHPSTRTPTLAVQSGTCPSAMVIELRPRAHLANQYIRMAEVNTQSRYGESR